MILFCLALPNYQAVWIFFVFVQHGLLSSQGCTYSYGCIVLKEMKQKESSRFPSRKTKRHFKHETKKGLFVLQEADNVAMAESRQDKSCHAVVSIWSAFDSTEIYRYGPCQILMIHHLPASVSVAGGSSQLSSVQRRDN